MIFKCDGLDLADALNKVLKATSNKTTQPILEGVKLEAYEDKLILSATDLELSIQKTIKANVSKEGKCVVPGRLFSDYIRKLTNEQITCELSNNNQLKINYTDSEGYLQCFDVLEFPTITNIEKNNYFLISQKKFKNLINKVIFAVATDDSRPILKGCLIEVENKMIKSVALDGYRLAVCNENLKESTNNFKIVVPFRSLSEIGKMLNDNDDLVKVYINLQNIMIDFGDTILISRLLEGEFINYRQIIHSQFATTITLNKQQLDDAIDRASILSKIDKNNLVKFNIKEKSLILTSNSDIGNITENLNVILKGNDLLIAFNSKYFTDALRVIGDEYINLNFTNSVNPCIITPQNGDEYLYLILPVRIIN